MTALNPPRFEKQFLSCRCGHEWEDFLPIDCRVEMFTAAVGSLTCPGCGAGTNKIMFGQNPKRLPVDTGTPIEQRVREWRNGSDTGLSSRQIADTMMGLSPEKGSFGWDYPSDPGDLGRCLRLLRLIPEWRPRIGEMSRCGAVWDQLATHWTELETMMADEVGLFWEKGKSATKTYARMRELIEAGREVERATA